MSHVFEAPSARGVKWPELNLLLDRSNTQSTNLNTILCNDSVRYRLQVYAPSLPEHFKLHGATGRVDNMINPLRPAAHTLTIDGNNPVSSL